LIGYTFYENHSSGLKSLAELVFNEFSKALPRRGDVHVVPVLGSTGIPLLYSLKSQGPVEVLLEAMHLPECQQASPS
jgi:hypothetical protein